MIIILVLGAIFAVFGTRLLFKNSILSKIVALWVINILLNDVNSKMGRLFPDEYPFYLSMPVGFIISIFLIYQVYRLIRKPFDQSIKDLEELSKGNLDINEDISMSGRNDELGRLKQSIITLSTTLKDVMKGVKTSSEQISWASKEIRNSAHGLSEGASGQAAAAEEISVSMEQMVAAIRQNSQDSVESKEIALQTSDSMNKLSLAANESLSSIKSIAKKISVINDIAYKTDILAINAAIEAARAGIHGDGFAVVASEVRRLAEKSKLAAEEISALSISSVEITEETDRLLSESLPKLEKTVKLVEQISNASYEQNSGVGQINNAIGDLNDVTQRNAASSEELAKGAEELFAQAGNLNTLIDFFKYSKDQTELSMTN